MTECDRLEPRISEWVDGVLDPDLQADIDAHLAACSRCRGVASDLRRLRDAARTLGPLEPPDHVYLEAAGRIRLEAPARLPHRTATSRRGTAQWISIAAALVLVTIGLWTISRPGSTDPSASASANPADIVSAELDLAVAHYERAIATLESMAAANQLPVEAGVTATLRNNLTVVDRAIAESRTALAASPDDATARDSLFDALRQKVGLLEATVQLLNDVQREGSDLPAPAPSRSGRSS